MSSTTDSIDWMRVVVHGLFGAALGAGLGFALWAFALSTVNVAIVMGVPAAILAVVAAIWGEPFWESMKESNWWNPFAWL